jgi:hypothetical protein
MNSVRLLWGTAIAATLALAAYIVVVYVLGKDEIDGTVATVPSQETAQNKVPDILTYVPADTIYFFGGLEPTPVKDMLESMPPEWRSMQQVDFKQDLDKEQKMPPAAKMLMGLFIEYMRAIQDPNTATAAMGIGDEVYSALYSVGTTPVLRIKLADANAFKQFVQRAEAAMQISPVTQTQGDLTLSTYSFQQPEAEPANATDTKLVIVTNNDYALITLFMQDDGTSNAALRDAVLGSKKPANPLSNTTVLQDIKNKHGFHPSYLGYLNHEEIMKGLTTPESNAFGRMLSALMKTTRALEQQKQNEAGTAVTAGTENETNAGTMAETKPDNIPKNPLAPIQTAACQKELMSITKTWPRTVFGYTQFEVATKPMKMTMRMLVENTDPAYMQELQKLRGFIPANLLQPDSKPVFGMGFGFNVDALTPVASKVISDFTQKDYQCQPLAAAKQKLITSNPLLAMGMMTGMAAGVQGISATILDFDGDLKMTQQGAQPDIRSIDAIITLSAKDPQRLLAMAANFQKGMPPIQIPADGTPVDLPIPLPAPNLGPIKLAQKGSHLVAYIGTKATQLAQTMSSDPLTATGMFAFSMDFGRYMKFISDMAMNAEGPEGKVADQLSEQDKAMFKEMTKMDMHVNETFDMTSQGLAFDAKMTMN